MSSTCDSIALKPIRIYLVLNIAFKQNQVLAATENQTVFFHLIHSFYSMRFV